MLLSEADDIEILLKKHDWNFPNSSTRNGVNSIHPYPAKFIHEIPRTLIQELPPKKDTIILDPFCGSGTTLVEAQKSNIESVGIDLNPIACLISNVKTNDLPKTFLDTALNCINNAKKDTGKEEQEINIPNIDHWFKKDVQSSIANILDEINEVKNIKTKNALRLALSSIIVRISNQDSDTRYAAVEKNISKDDVYTLFKLSCEKIYKSISDTELENKKASTIINKDILKVKPSDIKKPVGLVITSPPYPNAYEYWLYHKYRMFWLGYNPLEVKDSEIGARAHFFKKNHHTKESFLEQMSKTFHLLSSILIKDGHICFVVGRSIIHGEVVDNASIIKAVAEREGLKFITQIDRDILSKRKSFNLKHGKIKQENILVFRK